VRIVPQTRVPPVERVRQRLAASLGRERAAALPRGYERLGSVLVLSLPPALRPNAVVIGEAYREEFGVAAVLVRSGPIGGVERLPRREFVAGANTVTEVLEHGIRYRFDAQRIMFSRGNKEERARIGRLVRPGERVADLFAGIGYFALPALVHGRAERVDACEVNPVALTYLVENARVNGVAERLNPFPGDCREAPLPVGSYDRVILGLLPSAVGYADLGVRLLKPRGGWLHVHLTTSRHGDLPNAEAAVVSAVGRAGAAVETRAARRVKEYGPGRSHVVVDVCCYPAEAPTAGVLTDGERALRSLTAAGKADTNRETSSGGLLNETRTNRLPKDGER
jgi:tRNA wybutosine-synthesizing protein 2